MWSQHAAWEMMIFQEHHPTGGGDRWFRNKGTVEVVVHVSVSGPIYSTFHTIYSLSVSVIYPNNSFVETQGPRSPACPPNWPDREELTQLFLTPSKALTETNTSSLHKTSVQPEHTTFSLDINSSNKLLYPYPQPFPSIKRAWVL